MDVRFEMSDVECAMGVYRIKLVFQFRLLK